MDGSSLAALGWQPRVEFDAGLSATIDWYRDNRAWWEQARGADWQDWYKRQYQARLAQSIAAG